MRWPIDFAKTRSRESPLTHVPCKNSVIVGPDPFQSGVAGRGANGWFRDRAGGRTAAGAHPRPCEMVRRGQGLRLHRARRPEPDGPEGRAAARDEPEELRPRKL